MSVHICPFFNWVVCFFWLLICVSLFILSLWFLRYLPVWSFFCYFKKSFDWSIVDFQCCVIFKCTAKWISFIYAHAHSHTHTTGLSSVQFSRSVASDSLRPHESQHARPPCPSPTPGVHSDSRPSSQWCHPAIPFSVVPFSSCPQSLPASESFPMSKLFAWGGQSIGVSALASFLPKNTQDWCPLEWTGWISLQSKGLSRVFSNTIVQKHQFFGTQPSSQSNSHIHTWPQEKP